MTRRLTVLALLVVGLLGLTSLAQAQGIGSPNARGRVTTSAPTYTNNTYDYLSIDTSGNLRVNCTSGCAAAGDQSTGSTAIAGSGQTINVALAGERGAAFQLQSGGTLIATVTPKCSFDGGTIYNANGYIQDPVTGQISLTATIASGQATTDYPVMCPQGSSHAQLNATAFTSGSANFLARATVITWPGIAWGAVTTAAPTYSNNTINVASLDTSGNLRVLASQSGAPWSVTQAGNGAILSNQQGVTASAVALASNSIKRINVKAMAGNTAVTYVGASGVTTGTGYELMPGDATGWINLSNSNLVFIIGTTTNNVSWVAEN